MSEVTATEAARRFADLLDAVEHAGSRYTITRRGKAVAQIEPISRGRRADAKALFRRHRPDANWSRDLHGLRDRLEPPHFDLRAGYIRVMALSDEKYIRFTTFKKDGTEVSTPTWIIAVDDGKLGFYTSSTSGKVKRLRNNPNVVVQSSDARGRVKPSSSPLNGTAVVVTGPERDAIYDKVVAKYGFMTKLTRLLAKVGGFVKRKDQPYADRGVVITLSE